MGFVGWLILVYLGLEGLGVFVFLVFVFFCVGFVSVLFALFLFCCWIVFGVGYCFLFLFFWFCFCLFLLASFGGFKGQVRWPKEPPHLALSPPNFYFLCLFFLFLVCFLVFWRV